MSSTLRPATGCRHSKTTSATADVPGAELRLPALVRIYRLQSPALIANAPAPRRSDRSAAGADCHGREPFCGLLFKSEGLPNKITNIILSRHYINLGNECWAKVRQKGQYPLVV